MRLLHFEDDYADLRLSVDELVLLSNALDEICSGIDYDEVEFADRIGVDRSEAEMLQRRLLGVLERLGISLEPGC